MVAIAIMILISYLVISGFVAIFAIIWLVLQLVSRILA